MKKFIVNCKRWGPMAYGRQPNIVGIVLWCSSSCVWDTGDNQTTLNITKHSALSFLLYSLKKSSETAEWINLAFAMVLAEPIYAYRLLATS